MKRKGFIIICIMVLFISLTTYTSAGTIKNLNSQIDINAASDLISKASCYGTEFNLNEYMKNNLYISAKLPLYELKDNVLVEIDDFNYYPVLDSTDAVRGMIIERFDANGKSILEYSTFLCDQINANYCSSSGTNIIFDAEKVWMYDGQKYVAIYVDSYRDNSRSDFANFLTTTSQMRKTYITRVKQLNLTMERDSAASRVLDVPVYIQGSGTKICGACSAVSAGEYKSPSNIWDPEYIAIKYVGDIYTELNVYMLQEVLREEYDLEPVLYYSGITLEDVVSRINADNPIIARASYDSLFDGHFFVIKGYHSAAYPSASYIYIMDPSYGNRLIPATYSSSEGRYIITYTRASNGAVCDVDFNILVRNL